MTRELNVKITLSECPDETYDDEVYEDLILEAIECNTTNYQVCVEVETVKPERAKR